MLPLLATMGDPERIFHVGAKGPGYAVKLCLNLLWFIHAAAAAEVLVLGVRAGVDLAILRRALVASPANSNFLEHDIDGLLAAGDYDEGFTLDLVTKDLGPRDRPRAGRPARRWRSARWWSRSTAGPGRATATGPAR